MKKGISILLILILLATLLVGCGNNETQDTTPPPTTPGPVVTPPVIDDDEDEDPVTITYAFWGDASERESVQATVDRFMDEFPWITVELINMDRGDFEPWLNTMAAAGTLPDTAMMSEAMVIPWATRGALLPVDINAIVEAVGDTPLPHLGFQYGGQALAYSVCNNIVALFYNVDRFEAAGLDAPPKNLADAWTWEEFLDVAKTLTLDSAGRNAHDPGFDRNNVVQYAIRMYDAAWMLETWAHANNGSWFDGPNNLTIDQPAATDALQMIADLYLVHGVSPQMGTNEGTIGTWLVEDTAMAINGTWSFGVWLGDAHRDHGLNFNVGVLPRMAGQATLSTAGTNVMMADTENPRAASIFLAWYAQPENAWGLVEDGIWMPIFSQWYQDEAMMRRWSDNDYPGRTAPANFPPFDDYRSAVIGPASDMNYVVSAAWYTVPNMDVFLVELGIVMTPIWDGTMSAADAIAAGMDALRAANRG
ncbi:MAG: extracellular solute-binding protein [Oscillospiraceae bacterium]|nr:extracellular solute-binding protein [Oscillospiraceae bacterium]